MPENDRAWNAEILEVKLFNNTLSFKISSSAVMLGLLTNVTATFSPTGSWPIVRGSSIGIGRWPSVICTSYNIIHLHESLSRLDWLRVQEWDLSNFPLAAYFR